MRCPSCKGRVVVARSTGFMAMFGSTVLGLVGAAVAIRLTGSNGLAICTGSIAGTVLGAGLMGKLGLRLEVEGFD